MVDGRKLNARMTSETTRTKVVEGLEWKKRGSIEEIRGCSQLTAAGGVVGGVQSCIKVGS